MIPYEILIRGTADGKLSGSHVIDTPGANARPITPADLADIAPSINAAAILESSELVAAHTSVLAAKDAALSAAQAAQAAAEAKVEALLKGAQDVLALPDTQSRVEAAEALIASVQATENEKKRIALAAEIASKQAELAAL